MPEIGETDISTEKKPRTKYHSNCGSFQNHHSNQNFIMWNRSYFPTPKSFGIVNFALMDFPLSSQQLHQYGNGDEGGGREAPNSKIPAEKWAILELTIKPNK